MSRYLFNLTIKGDREINARPAAATSLIREIGQIWSGLDMTVDELTHAIGEQGLALSKGEVAAILKGGVANVDLLTCFAQALAGVER